jgi:flagellar motor switch protein FliG
MTAHPILGDAERAAVLVMLLDESQAAKILSALGPEELRVLGEKMCTLGDIGPTAISHSVAAFVEHTESMGLSDHDRVGHVQALMTRAVGEVKADSLMQRILPEPPRQSPLELARWLTPQVLAPMVQNEHPQVIAVLLAQLDPKVAAEVLHALPPEVHTQVVHRVATLGPVSAEAISMLEDLLARRIEEHQGHAGFQMGGPREAAEIINNAAKTVEKRVMPELTRMDKQLARKIENEMFKFEHLFALDQQAMGMLLREVESETLIDALKGIGLEEREFFFRAMSSRAADGVRDEIETRGRIRMADVVEAQKQIIAAARRLAAEGSISFGQSDDEYV